MFYLSIIIVNRKEIRKFMLGGYQILDLRNIDLSHGTSASNITNAYVLNQLLKLREHIEKSYDFSKALNNQLKPVLIRYRDKKVGEKHESAVFGALEVVNTYYKFKIVAENNGERLMIDVEFEEKTYENDEKYWGIKTAKILLTQEVAIFENITDKDEHKRFIEGDITINEITGVTKSYGKWSLSGTHLLIVLCLDIADTTELPNGTIFTTLDIPNWIKEKIVELKGAYVERKTFPMVGENWSTQDLQCTLGKASGNNLNITCRSTITLTADRSVRIAFDLLIDNASE